MRKSSNILFIIMISLFVIPFVVSAETFEIGETEYTIEYKEIGDYVCDEIKGHNLIAHPYDKNKLSVYDEDDSKVYIIDLTNPGVCLDYVPSSFENSETIYLWENTNELYEQKYDVTYQYGYYIKDTNDYEYFEKAQGEYDSSAEYYELYEQKIDDFLSEVFMSPVTSNDETAFENGEYYVISSPVSRKLIVKTTKDEFIATKEKTGLSKDISCSKDSILGYFNFNNKVYLIFENFEGYMVVFDESGNYQTFGNDIIAIKSISSSDSYVYLYAEQNSKDYLLIMDKDFDLIYKKQVDVYNIYNIGSYENIEYLIQYDKDGESIIEFTKLIKENGIVPNTYDGIATSIIVGVIALLGLVVTILFIKRRKSN